VRRGEDDLFGAIRSPTTTNRSNDTSTSSSNGYQHITNPSKDSIDPTVNSIYRCPHGNIKIGNKRGQIIILPQPSWDLLLRHFPDAIEIKIRLKSGGGGWESWDDNIDINECPLCGAVANENSEGVERANEWRSGSEKGCLKSFFGEAKEKKVMSSR